MEFNKSLQKYARMIPGSRLVYSYCDITFPMNQDFQPARTCSKCGAPKAEGILKVPIGLPTPPPGRLISGTSVKLQCGVCGTVYKEDQSKCPRCQCKSYR